MTGGDRFVPSGGRRALGWVLPFATVAVLELLRQNGLVVLNLGAVLAATAVVSAVAAGLAAGLAATALASAYLLFTIREAGIDRLEGLRLLGLGAVSLLAVVVVGMLLRSLAQQQRAAARATARLAAAERLQRLLGAADVVVWEADADGRFIFLSDNLEHVVGIPVETWRDGDLDRLVAAVHPADRPALTAALAAGEGHDADLRLRVQAGDGGERRVRLVVRRLPDGNGHRRLQGLIQDLSGKLAQQEALHQHRVHLDALFHYARDAIYLYPLTTDGTPGRFLDVNDSACRVTGYTREQLLGMTLRELVAPGEPVPERMAALLEHGHVRVESRHRTRDGQPIDVEVDATLVELHGRQTVLAVAREIGERKRMEAALRASEEQLRTAIEALPVGIWFTDADGSIILANSAGRRIWGGARYVGPEGYAEYRGWWADSGRPLAAEDWGLARAIGRGETSINEVIDIESFDGERKTILNSAVPVRDEDGTILGAVVVNEDITGRRRQEAALAREHAAAELERRRLRAVLDVLPVAVFIADADGRLTDTNRTAGEIWDGAAPLSSHPGEYAGDYAAWWPDGRPVGTREWGMARAIERGETVLAEEMEIRTGGGRRKTILNSAVPIRTPSGDIAGAVAINVDVTEQKRHQRELERLNATLEQRVAERAAVAEARTAQLQALALELTRAEEHERRRLAMLVHDHLQQLLVAAKMRLASIVGRTGDERTRSGLEAVDELLAESIAESKSLAVELSPPVLYDAGLGPALEWLARRKHGKYGLEVTVRVEEHAEPEDAIRVVLFEAARELLFNVVKHAGTLAAEVTLRALDDERVELAVVDRGTGFDPAELGRSSGFGLFGIRERLELLGGSFSVTSRPGEGTEVRLTAPRRAATPSETPELDLGETHPAPGRRRHPVPSSGGSVRVLLADDHEILRNGMVSLLAEHEGIEVVGEARDGVEAVELARALQPDVVLMDVTMPRLGGVEATRQILDCCPQIRVVGLSMHEEADLAAAMREAGAVDYLTKGGSADRLLRAIREAVEGQGSS